MNNQLFFCFIRLIKGRVKNMDVVTSFPLNYKQKLKRQKLRLKFFLGLKSVPCLKIIKPAIEQVVSEF